MLNNLRLSKLCRKFRFGSAIETYNYNFFNLWAKKLRNFTHIVLRTNLIPPNVICYSKARLKILTFDRTHGAFDKYDEI